jgi:hypothetical protein
LVLGDDVSAHRIGRDHAVAEQAMNRPLQGFP